MAVPWTFTPQRRATDEDGNEYFDGTDSGKPGWAPTYTYSEVQEMRKVFGEVEAAIFDRVSAEGNDFVGRRLEVLA